MCVHGVAVFLCPVFAGNRAECAKHERRILHQYYTQMHTTVRPYNASQNGNALPFSMTCMRCGDTGWMCEVHSDRTWPHGACAGPGVPCPSCNTSDPPRALPGFVSLLRDGDFE